MWWTLVPEMWWILAVVTSILKPTDGLDVYLRVNDHFWLYADGTRVQGPVDGLAGVELQAPDNTEVFAMRVENQASGGRTMVFASRHGDVSDVTWRCTHVLEAGWQTTDFDDSGWSGATQLSAFTRVPSSYSYGPAYKIWTDETSGAQNTAYCRKRALGRLPFTKSLVDSSMWLWRFHPVIKPLFMVSTTYSVNRDTATSLDDLDLCAVQCVTLQPCHYFIVKSDNSTGTEQFTCKYYFE